MSPNSEVLPPVVVVIDDDANVREALDSLFRSVGLCVYTFTSVERYWDSVPSERPGCLVLDVRLRGKSGLDFQQDLVSAGDRRPVVFISGHADVEMCVRAMKAGAVEFLTKPVRDQDLLDAVHAAIVRDAQTRQRNASLARRRADIARLTPREQEVMGQVVAGRLNKQIAAHIGVTEGMVKVYRGQVMRKLNVPTLPDLVRLAEAVNLDRPVPGPKA